MLSGMLKLSHLEVSVPSLSLSSLVGTKKVQNFGTHHYQIPPEVPSIDTATSLKKSKGTLRNKYSKFRSFDNFLIFKITFHTYMQKVQKTTSWVLSISTILVQMWKVSIPNLRPVAVRGIRQHPSVFSAYYCRGKPEHYVWIYPDQFE